MERVLQRLINKTNPKHLELLFGKGSYFKINKIHWLTQKKCYQIILTLYCTDLELTKDSYPDGVNYFVRDAWSLIDYGNEYVLVSSLDVKI
jgi:hypothetical protein